MLKEFQELLDLPAWSRLVEMATAQMKMRQDQLLMPMHERTAVSIDRPLPTDEFLKGESSGVRLFTQLPNIIMESAKAVIDNEKEKEDGRNDAASSA